MLPDYGRNHHKCLKIPSCDVSPFHSKVAVDWGEMGKSMSGHITGLDARMILDSRGNPTVEVDCYVDGGLARTRCSPIRVLQPVPMKRSRCVMRSIAAKYLGKGVLKAVDNVDNVLKNSSWTCLLMSKNN